MGWILFFIFLLIISFIEGWYTLGIILSVVAVAFIILMVWSSAQTKKEEEERQAKRDAEKERKRVELETVTIPSYNNARSDLVNKYGEPTKSIVIEQYNLDKEIHIFEKDKRVWICGQDLPFKSVLNCSFTDSPIIQKGTSVSTTSTNSGNMVKRAVVGQVVAGSAGAIIGGSTASKSTVTNQSADKITHNYTVIINVNSLVDPMIRIPLGQDGKTVNEIVAIMNVIINRR